MGNESELSKIEENYSKRRKILQARIDIQAGGLEFFNMVLTSTKKFREATSARGYKDYNLTYSTVGNANHYSIIKPAVDKIMLEFRE